MTRREKNSDRLWVGVLGAENPGDWVKQELEREEIYDEAFAPPGAKVVSVRVEPATLAMLEAFGDRFKETRSSLLLRFIQSGLAEAFHALPDDEQSKMIKRATVKAHEAGWKVDFGPREPARRIDTPDDDESEVDDG